MKNLRKVIKLSLIIIFLLIIGVGILALRMSFRNTNEQITEQFKAKKIPINIEQFQYKENSLRFMTTGNTDAETAIIFIHGAPGGMDMFNSVLMDKELQEQFYLLSVDRLGYGFSGYGTSVTSMEKQAESINHLILEKISQSNIILFAHSFGGPIAAYIPTINPMVRNVILAGAAVSPNHERFEALAWLANSKMLSWIASKDTKVASDEKLSHVNELKRIQHIWHNYPANLIVMHGTKDWLVPYGNSMFLKENVPQEKFIDKTLEGESHFFINDIGLLKSVFIETEQKIKEYAQNSDN